MTAEYTEEELQALPQTTTVFAQPGLNIDEHVWLQEGYRIIEQCHNNQAIPIPSGTMLMKKEGRYTLVDEITRK